MSVVTFKVGNTLIIAQLTVSTPHMMVTRHLASIYCEEWTHYYHWPFCPYRHFALLFGDSAGNRALVRT